LRRHSKNPVLGPRRNFWESLAVFNPGAVRLGDRTHVLYRAIGEDGISRLGHASSENGFDFDKRSDSPVFSMLRPGRSGKYSFVLYPSGGSWGGSEDPRIVKIGDRIYVTFNAFDGWDFVRAALVSISEEDFLAGRWNWSDVMFLSPEGEVHKNWVLFPEKIRGRFAILHSITPEVQVDYVDSLEDLGSGKEVIRSRHGQRSHGRWDAWVRSAGPPPVRTEKGWLVLYHAIEASDPGRYKMGAMLLDLEDPRKVIARSGSPIFSPDTPYENDWKPGVVYACGAVLDGDEIRVYYGGGDKTVSVASAPLSEILKRLAVV